MSIEKMREEIAKEYGEAWVNDKPDSQIAAIYFSMVNRGLVKPKVHDPYKNFKRFN